MDKTDKKSSTVPSVEAIFERVRDHQFHPINNRNFTVDQELEKEGIANLNDKDWQVRLLAVRDLIRNGDSDSSSITAGLEDEDFQVRYLSATALGALRAQSEIEHLERVIQKDPNAIVRSQATVALGQIGANESLELLRDRHANDAVKEVRHQAELVIDRIEKGANVGAELEIAYRNINPNTFERLSVGETAPSFELPDTDGQTWDLNKNVGGGEWTILLWVFADWCPVCHREFDELIELRDELAEANINVATVECHDQYRGRVMVGQELEPDFWFAEEPFIKEYTNQIWWPHLIDRAGAIGAQYGVDPMAYAVHAEYINRPTTIIIDPKGTVQFAYYGTFWGDRPSVADILEMIQSKKFDFEHPKRRTIPTE